MILDNTTAVAYINECGGTKSSSLTQVAKRLVEFCEKRSISLEACHLAGIRNVVADAESRATPDASDWRLNSDVFNQIFSQWPCDMDLFSAA